MKIKIDDNYIDPATVDSILQVEVDNSGGGEFGFKPETEIVLKNGRSFRTKKSTTEVHDLLYIEPNMTFNPSESDTSVPSFAEDVCNTEDRIPSGCEPCPPPLPGDIDLADVVRVGEMMLDSVRQLVEHTHTISEMLTRLTLHITEGSAIYVVRRQS